MTSIPSVVFVKTDAQVSSFAEQNRGLIFQAFHRARLPRHDWDGVMNNMLIKFAKGKLDFNASKGAKYSTFIYGVARNCALDELQRRHPEPVDVMDKHWENLRDGHEFQRSLEGHDAKVIVQESLKRLVKEVRDKKKVEILVRFVLNGEDRDAVAQSYHVAPDYVSVVKTRYYGRLQRLAREVLKQDEEGRLETDGTDISFLNPYLKLR
jgi:hypothetical protein